MSKPEMVANHNKAYLKDSIPFIYIYIRKYNNENTRVGFLRTKITRVKAVSPECGV